MKTTHYQFTKPSFECSWNVDIKPRKHRITDSFYDDEDENISSDFLKFSVDCTRPRPGFGSTSDPDFFDCLYFFIKDYNDKYKNLKMKKEHQSYVHDGCTSSPMMVFLNVKNGVGFVSYCPLLEGMTDFKFEKHMWGSFRIKKEDMLNFLNKWSKKMKFRSVVIDFSPASVLWSIKNFETHIEILKKENEELKKQLKKKPSI